MTTTKSKSAWKKKIVAKEVALLKPMVGKLHRINNLPAETYMNRFVAAAKKHGFKKRSLSFGRALFYLGTGPKKVLITSGIHGEERAGPIALLHYLENTPKGQLIAANSTLMVCPLIGHDAWNNKKRKENNKTNLNSVWYHKHDKDPKTLRIPRYIQEMKRAIIKFKPEFFLDFHEDTTIKDKEPYCFRMNTNRGMVYNLQGVFGLSRKKGVWSYPDWIGTTETFVAQTGRLETTTIETPQSKHLKFRVGFDLGVLKWLKKTLENAEAT